MAHHYTVQDRRYHSILTVNERAARASHDRTRNDRDRSDECQPSVGRTGSARGPRLARLLPSSRRRRAGTCASCNRYYRVHVNSRREKKEKKPLNKKETREETNSKKNSRNAHLSRQRPVTDSRSSDCRPSWRVYTHIYINTYACIYIIIQYSI